MWIKLKPDYTLTTQYLGDQIKNADDLARIANQLADDSKFKAIVAERLTGTAYEA